MSIHDPFLRRPARRAVLMLAGLLFLLSFPVGSNAGWVSTGGPVGGLGYDVRIHPSDKTKMYVTDNYAGVAVSSDSGNTWKASNSGITIRGGASGDAINIFSLTVDQNNPNIIWAGTNGSTGMYGVFKSIDGGASWISMNNGLADAGFGLVFRGFTIKQGDSNTVYAMAEEPTANQGAEFNKTNGRLFKTVNGGASWSLLYTNQNLFRYLIIDPNNSSALYLSTGIFDREPMNYDCSSGMAGGGLGVLKSTDGGASWTQKNGGLTDLYVGSLRMSPANSSVLFAATGNNACSGAQQGNTVSGLFMTTNGGDTWSKVISGDIMTSVNFSASNPSIVYAGSANAIYRSADGGTTWIKYANSSGVWGPEGMRAGVPIDLICDSTNPNLLYANNYGGGVFKSSDGGQTWQIWSRGYTGADIHEVVIAPSDPTKVFAIGRSGPYKSLNYGLDWIPIATGAANPFGEWYGITVHPTNPDIIVIADEHQGVILKSSDGGASFSLIMRQPNANASSPLSRQGFKSLAFAPSSPNVVYAGLARDRGHISQTNVPIGQVFYKSADSGSTFVAGGTGLNGLNVNRIVVNPADPNTLWAATSNGIFKSSDGGANWSSLSATSGQDTWSLAVSGTNIIYGQKDAGIRASSDGGTTWSQLQNAGISGTPFIRALVYSPSSPNTVYAADYYSGVYVSSNGGASWGVLDGGPSFRASKDLSVSSAGGKALIYLSTEGGGVQRDGGPLVIPAPSSISFASGSIGQSSSPVTVVVYNTDSNSKTVSSTSLTGTNASEFSITNDVCSGRTISSGSSCSVGVIFSPASGGNKSASLSISSNDPYQSNVLVPLTGGAASSGGGGGKSGMCAYSPDGEFDIFVPLFLAGYAMLVLIRKRSRTGG